jgi:predicted nucleotidyltransferase
MGIELDKDSKEFIELLNSNNINYMIAGGHAVAFHGHPRATGDIDIFVEISEDNASKIASALANFGFAGLGLTAQDFLLPKTIVQLGYPPHRIDILTSLSGVTFDEAKTRAVHVIVDGVSLVFIGREDLLVNKATTGRPKDLADLQALSREGQGSDDQGRSALFPSPLVGEGRVGGQAKAEAQNPPPHPPPQGGRDLS